MSELKQQEKDLSEMAAPSPLLTKYREAIALLEAEEAKLQAQLNELLRTRGTLAPISEAKLRVLTQEADVALSRGKVPEADKKKEEQESIRQHAADLNREIEQASNRLQEIAGEKEKIANRVFTELYPKIQTACFEAIEGLVDLLDTSWALIQEYSQDTGAKISGYHRQNLVPPPMGKTRFLRERFARWF